MTFWVKSIYAILICQEISQDHDSPKKKKKSFGWRELYGQKVMAIAHMA
jgi:hypothetical protein